MKLILTINIQNKTGFRLKKNKIEHLIKSQLKKRGFSGRWEMGVFLVKKETIKSINQKYRQINQVTDVLSFGINEKKIKAFNKQILPLYYLGDIFLCPSYISQAVKNRLEGKWLILSTTQQRNIVSYELEYILKHGLLHLLGIHHD